MNVSRLDPRGWTSHHAVDVRILRVLFGLGKEGAAAGQLGVADLAPAGLDDRTFGDSKAKWSAARFLFGHNVGVQKQAFVWVKDNSSTSGCGSTGHDPTYT